MSRPKENPWVNLAINVILPIVILQQVSKRLGPNGPIIALILALALPVGYFIWDYLKHRHRNYMSAFGVLSVLFTGGFALFQLEGIWFAVKEAAFPAIMAIGTIVSAYSKTPLVAAMFCNDQVLDMNKINLQLTSSGRTPQFHLLLRRATLWFASSFVLSALLNFVVAQNIFIAIDPSLPELQRSTILNEQVAKMTGMGFLVIALPMMVFTGFILFFFLRRLSSMTDLTIDQLMKAGHSNPAS